MIDQHRGGDNVYLLPNTVVHAQRELTRMLEFERYEEACGLLRFLIRCEGDVGDVREEWQALLVWLETMFPEAVDWGEHGGIMTGQRAPEDENEVTEDDLLRLHMRDKAAHDPGYIRQLLQMFRQPLAPDKQMLALEQLRVLELPELNEIVREWITANRLPPLIQFRALQVLKERGAAGAISLIRNGEPHVVELAHVPVELTEYPAQAQQVLLRIQSACDRYDPHMAGFAEQTWMEFLAYAFGTASYRELTGLTEESSRVWACAFHYMLLMASIGFASEEELQDLYGLTEDAGIEWRKALQHFERFASDVFPAYR